MHPNIQIASSSFPLSQVPSFSLTYPPQPLSPPPPPYRYSSTPLPSDRLDQLLINTELPLYSSDGTVYLGKIIFLKDFFYFLLLCFQENGIFPHRMDCIGGSAAWLIGPDLAKTRAKKLHLTGANLDEFNHLKDIDLAIDLLDYPSLIHNEIPFLVVEALKRSGIQGSHQELLSLVFFRDYCKVNDQMAIQSLSIGDKKKFWMDLAFLTRRQPREHLFPRDALRVDLLPLFKGEPSLFWATDLSDPWIPIDQRLMKKLTVDHPETINHYGFVYLCLYLARGYTLQNPEALPILKRTFLDHHRRCWKGFKEILDKVKLNHIRNPEEWEDFLLHVFLLLLSDTQPYEWLFLFQSLEGSQTKSGRFVQACLKNLLDSNSPFSIREVLCLSCMIFPSLPLIIQPEEWRFFLESPPSLPGEIQQLLGSKKSFPLFLATFILQHGQSLLPFPPIEALIWIEALLSEKEKPAFYSMIHEEIKKGTMTPPSLEIRWFIHALPFLTPPQQQEGLNILLQRLSPQHLPFLSKQFLQAIKKPKAWINKFLLLGNVGLSIDLAACFNKADIHNLILSYFIEKKHPADFLEYYSKINQKFPELKDNLLQGTPLCLDDYDKKREQLQQEIRTLQAQGKSEQALEKIKTSSPHFRFELAWADTLFSDLALHLPLPRLLELFSLWKENNPDSALFAKHKHTLIHTLCQTGKIEEPFKKWLLQESSSLTLEQSTLLLLQELIQKNLSCLSPLEVERFFRFFLKEKGETVSSQDLLFLSFLLAHLSLKQHSLSEKNKALLSSLFCVAFRKGLWKELRELTVHFRAHRLHLRLKKNFIPLLYQEEKSSLSESDRLEIWKFVLQKASFPHDFLLSHALGETRFLLLWIQQNQGQALQWLHQQRRWKSDEEKLSILAGLPLSFTLRASLFYSLARWPEAEWEKMWDAAKEQESQKRFALLIDPRSPFRPSLASQLPCSSLNFYQSLSLLKLKFTFTAEMWKHLFQCASEGEPSSYSWILSQLLEKAPSLLKDILEDKKGFDALDQMVHTLGMNEHPLAASLLISCAKMENLIDPQKQKSFFSHLLSCLPLPQNEKAYSADEQLLLSVLTSFYSPDSPLADALTLLFEESSKKQKTLRKLLSFPLSKQDKRLQKLMLGTLIDLSEKEPSFWLEEGGQLLLQFLRPGTRLLSLPFFIDRLKESSHLGLRAFALQLTLEEGKIDEKHKLKCLETLERVVQTKQWTLLKKVLQMDALQSWSEEIRLKKVYGDFLLEMLKQQEMSSLELVVDLFRFAHIRDSSWLKQTVVLLAKQSAKCLFETKDLSRYYSLKKSLYQQLAALSKEQNIYKASLFFTRALLDEIPDSCEEAFSLKMIPLFREELFNLMGVRSQRDLVLPLQTVMFLFVSKMLPKRTSDAQFHHILPCYLDLMDKALETKLFDLECADEVAKYTNGIFFIASRNLLDPSLQRRAFTHFEKVLKGVLDHPLIWMTTRLYSNVDVSLFIKTHLIINYFVFAFPPSHPEFQRNKPIICSYLSRYRLYKFQLFSLVDYLSWVLFVKDDFPLEKIENIDKCSWEAFERILNQFDKWEKIEGEDLLYLTEVFEQILNLAPGRLLINPDTFLLFEQFLEKTSPEKMRQVKKELRSLIEKKLVVLSDRLLFSHLLFQALPHETRDALAKQSINLFLKWYYKGMESEKEDCLPIAKAFAGFCSLIHQKYPPAALLIYTALKKTLDVVAKIPNRQENGEIRKMLMALFALPLKEETEMQRGIRQTLLFNQLKNWFEWETDPSHTEFFEFLSSENVQALLSPEQLASFN